MIKEGKIGIIVVLIVLATIPVYAAIGDNKLNKYNGPGGISLLGSGAYSGKDNFPLDIPYQFSGIPGTSSDDDYSWNTLVYLDESKSIFFRFDEVDDGVKIYLYPIKSGGYDGKKLTSAAAYIKYNDLISVVQHSPFTIKFNDVQKGFYRLLINHNNKGGSGDHNRYLYNFRPVDSNNNNVAVSYYFQLFHSELENNEIPWSAASGNEELTFDLSDISEADFLKLDGDVQKEICVNLQGKFWYDSVFTPLASTPLPLDKYCCGDDATSDFGYIIKAIDNKRYICKDIGWDELKTEQKECIDPDTGTGLSNTDFNFDIVSQSYFVNNASDGSDACCGNDPGCSNKYAACLNISPSECANFASYGCRYTPPGLGCTGGQICLGFNMISGCTVWGDCSDYTTQTSCEQAVYVVPTPGGSFNPCTWGNTPNGQCTGTLNINCASLNSEDCQINSLACNAVGGFGKDYGYITPDKRYICYNQKYDLVAPTEDDSWKWIDARNPQESFKILTLMSQYPLAEYNVDIISNSKEWNYCNAWPNIAEDQGLKGKAIDEGKSFDPVTQSNEIECKVLMTTIFSPTIFSDCSGPLSSKKNCCEAPNNIPVSYEIDELYSCTSECYGDKAGSYVNIDCDPNDDILKYFCEDYSHIMPTGEDDQLYDKSLCLFDGGSCIDDPEYDDTESCQFNEGTTCEDEQFCVLGFYINTMKEGEKEKCCFSPENQEICKDKPSVLSEDRCIELGGKVYDDSVQKCFGENVSIPGSQNRCCFYELYSEYDPSDLQLFDSFTPEAYICYKEQKNNLLSECAYDVTGPTLKSFYPELGDRLAVDLVSRRIYTQGSRLHSVKTYDEFVKGVSLDRVKKIMVRKSGSNRGHTDINDLDLSVENFSFLEFDILYPINKNPEVILNTQGTEGPTPHTLGNVKKFVTGSGAGRRWQHVVIPLAEIKGLYDSIIFKDDSLSTSSTYSILLDSIVLVPSTQIDLSANTKNYYCTGPYTSWIDNLDPTPKIIQDNNPNTLGPYKYACEAQASFDWTGHYCCGDDSYYYKEYFSDSEKGCFDGTKILNDWTVSYAYNVKETQNSFNDFEYKDILYYQNKFIGCQVPTGKYNYLNVSYGEQTTTTKLVNTFANNQCAVNGSYYCMDQAWRKNVQGIYSWNNLSLKSAPPGADLIINGDFEGDAPPIRDKFLGDVKS